MNVKESKNVRTISKKNAKMIFDMLDDLKRDFQGYPYDFVICYVLVEAIESIKKEMEEFMKKVATKKTAKKATKTTKKK